MAQRERHSREDGGDDTALGFKRHFVLPGLALALLELVAIAWPVLSLFRPAMGDRTALIQIAIPVLTGAQLTWWAAIGSWLSPIYRAIQVKRRGQRLPDDLAESAYRSTWRLPRRALLLRVALWMSIAVAHGLYLDHVGEWTTKQVIELSAVTGLCAFAVSLVRAVWYQLILARLRRRLFAGVPALKEFADGYFGVLMHVAMVVSAGTAVAIAAFTYYFLPISFEQTLQLHLVIPAALLFALVGMTLVTSHACGPIDAYLRGSTAEREALSTRVYRRAQALAYRLALTHICLWGLAAGAASWLARRTLGFAFDDSILMLAIWLDIAIGASIYQVLWHREAVRPLLDQLTLRHHLPVRAIRPSLSLRGKLLLSFGGLVLFAVGLALFWGFIQYKNLVTEFTWKQADLGLTWLRSEVQGAAAARETAPTPDLVHEVLHQVAGHYEARAALEEKVKKAKEAAAKPAEEPAEVKEKAAPVKSAVKAGAAPAKAEGVSAKGTAPAAAAEAAAAEAAAAQAAAAEVAAAEVAAASEVAPPDRSGPRAPEATSAVFYYVPNRPGAAVVAAGGGLMGAPELPWYARAQLKLTSAADAHIGLDAYSLAGRRGRLVVTWRDVRHDLGGLAVFYPDYRGRGPSLVRPLKELLFFFLVLFGTCAGFVVFTVGQFVKPIRRLEQRADGMARGELAQPVSSGGEGDEIGRLTFALEEMRRALREKLRSTEEVNLDLERAVQRRTADLAKKNRELAETLEKLTRAQDQLVRSEKMASIGQLVAGIAHEINNPVNAIVNTVGPLRGGDRSRARTSGIRRRARRGGRSRCCAWSSAARSAPRRSCRRCTTTRAPTTRAGGRGRPQPQPRRLARAPAPPAQAIDPGRARLRRGRAHPRPRRPAQPGLHEPPDQRGPGGRRAATARRSGLRPTRTRPGHHRGARQRPGHPGGGAPPHLRSVLHHQGRRRRLRPRPVDRPRHRRAPRRHHRGRQHPGDRHPLPRPPPPRRPRAHRRGRPLVDGRLTRASASSAEASASSADSFSECRLLPRAAQAGAGRGPLSSFRHATPTAGDARPGSKSRDPRACRKARRLLLRLLEMMARSILRRPLAILPALALAVTLGSGCVMSPRGAHTVANVAAAALWTAAVAGQIAILAYHDAHYHHDHCGHYRRWYSGRWVYYYGGHWEYYDDGAGNWYYYNE